MTLNTKTRLRAVATIGCFSAIFGFFCASALLAEPRNPSETAKKLVSPQWYILDNPSNETDPANLEIADTFTGTPPTSSPSECALQNNGPVCLVRLDLENFDGDAEDLIGMTVAQADAADAPILPQGSDDGLAKHPDN